MPSMHADSTAQAPKYQYEAKTELTKKGDTLKAATLSGTHTPTWTETPTTISMESAYTMTMPTAVAEVFEATVKAAETTTLAPAAIQTAVAASVGDMMKDTDTLKALLTADHGTAFTDEQLAVVAAAAA